MFYRARNRLWLIALAGTAALLLSACAGGQQPAITGQATPATPAGGTMTPPTPTGMGMDMATAPRVPPVFGYYDGESIFFIHTEASDEKISTVLTDMMGSPVPTVESLARVPDEATSTVYVFTNGVTPTDTPEGPMGFQPDVFDTAPGDPEYTPLRQIVEVTWKNEDQAQVLKSVEELRQAESDGRLTLTPTDVVVVAPLLTWPGDQR